MRGFEMKGAWFGKIEFAFTHNLSFYNMMLWILNEYVKANDIPYQCKKPWNQAKIFYVFVIFCQKLEFFSQVCFSK